MKVINVMAASLDGRIAAFPQETDESRRESGFTSEEDFQHLQEWISQADAIITGANSLRVTGGVFDLKRNDGSYPVWIVLTEKGLEPDLPFWGQTHIPRWVVTPQAAIKNVDHGSVKFLEYGTKDPAEFVVERLRKLENVGTVLLFGGGFINSLFYNAGLVNELILTLCPFLIGNLTAPYLVNPNLKRPVKFALSASQPLGSHVFLKYRVLT